MHRALRNTLYADDWKKSWSDIQLMVRRIDDGMRGQIGFKTLDMWKKIKSIETSTERIQSLQLDTMKSVKVSQFHILIHVVVCYPFCF